jgi:hypothetical protein
MGDVMQKANLILDHLKDVHQEMLSRTARGHQIEHLVVAQNQLVVSQFHFGQLMMMAGIVSRCSSYQECAAYYAQQQYGAPPRTPRAMLKLLSSFGLSMPVSIIMIINRQGSSDNGL